MSHVFPEESEGGLGDWRFWVRENGAECVSVDEQEKHNGERSLRVVHGSSKGGL